MTLEHLNKAHGDALEVVNDLYEMRLDHHELGHDINWLKRYAQAMDELHAAEIALIAYYQLNSIYNSQ